VVATPNHAHLAHAEWAIENGWDVLVEKPMTTSAAATHRLLLSAERAGVTVQPVHNYLNVPAVVRLRDMLVGLGPIAEIAYHHHLESPLRGLGADAGWRCQSAMAGGGALLDLGYHALYVIELLAGSPIFEIDSSAIEEPGAESRAVVSLRHRTGAQSFIDVGWSQPSFGWSLRVEAAGGHVEVDETGAIAMTAQSGQQLAELVPDGLSFEAMYRCFYAQLATGARDRARQAVRTQRWIERAYRRCA